MKKKSFLYTSILLITPLIFHCQNVDEEYLKTMIANLESMNYCKTIEEYRDQALEFEKIGEALSDRWRPFYYASFCRINMAFKAGDPDKTDEYLDKAGQLLDRASQIEPAESEIYALKALLYQARIKVNPHKRGPIYTEKAKEMLNEAKILDASNPRVFYLLGQNYMAIPEKLGGGADEACPNYQKAKELYKKFVPSNLISPRWGEVMNYEAWKKHCQ